jgi:hypothetical protein
VTVSQRELASIGAAWSDDDLWSLVKMQHALPALPRYLLPAARDASAASSWGDWRSYVTGLSRAQVDSLTYGSCGRYMPFGHLFDNAERVGVGGLQGFVDLNLILGMGGALVALWLAAALLPHGGVS